MIELVPDDSNAYYGRACAYACLDQPRQAVEDYSRSIDLDPGDVESWYGRGLARMELGQYRKAVEDFDQARRLDPYHPGVEHAREVAVKLAEEGRRDRDQRQQSGKAITWVLNRTLHRLRPLDDDIGNLPSPPIRTNYQDIWITPFQPRQQWRRNSPQNPSSTWRGIDAGGKSSDQ